MVNIDIVTYNTVIAAFGMGIKQSYSLNVWRREFIWIK